MRACAAVALRRRTGSPAAASASSASATSGARLARRLADAGCELAVSDIDPAKRELADELGADLGRARRRRCYASATCSRRARSAARSRPRTPPRCAATIVCGSANNQLADDSLAETLAERGILYAPDFIANAGGLIHVYREIKGYSEQRAMALAQGIEGTLGGARGRGQRGATPLAAARELARERLGRRSARLIAMEQLLVVRLGLVPYEEGVRMQRALERARADGEIADVLLLLEHPPVYTKGRRSTAGRAADGRGLVPDAGHRGGRDRPRRAGHLPRPRPAGRAIRS